MRPLVVQLKRVDALEPQLRRPDSRQPIRASVALEPPIADQRRLLVTTIRGAADWRAGRADKFEHDRDAHRENVRAKTALRTLANFVEGLPDDDRDLDLHALRRADEHGGRLQLTDDGMTLLSRFGINIGSWGDTGPTESQMRNVLRRVDGIEAKERRARKERAQAGYGDD